MWYRCAAAKDVLQIVDNNYDLYENIKNNIPDAALQPLAAYFLTQGVDINSIKSVMKELSDLRQKKPIQIQGAKTGVYFNGQKYNDWLSFTEEIHAIINLNKPKNNHIQKNNNVLSNTIVVKKIHNISEAIMYGAGESWCISSPDHNMWQTYRDNLGSTFYFIEDGFRDPKDPLSHVAIDVNSQGVKLTDKNNRTGNIAEFGGNWQEYFNYLRSHNVDITQFKNDPYTKQEQIESKILKDPCNLLTFKQFSYEYKSRYIGRNHILTNEQFEYLINNNAQDLIIQYLNCAHTLTPEQEKLISSKNNYKSTYKRARDSYFNALIKEVDEPEELLNAHILTEPMGADYALKLLHHGVNLQLLLKNITEFDNDTRAFEAVMDANPNTKIDLSTIITSYTSENIYKLIIHKYSHHIPQHQWATVLSFFLYLCERSKIFNTNVNDINAILNHCSDMDQVMPALSFIRDLKFFNNVFKLVLNKFNISSKDIQILISNQTSMGRSLDVIKELLQFDKIENNIQTMISLLTTPTNLSIFNFFINYIIQNTNISQLKKIIKDLSYYYRGRTDKHYNILFILIAEAQKQYGNDVIHTLLKDLTDNSIINSIYKRHQKEIT